MRGKKRIKVGCLQENRGKEDKKEIEHVIIEGSGLEELKLGLETHEEVSPTEEKEQDEYSTGKFMSTRKQN